MRNSKLCIIAVVLVALLFTGCNWNILTGDVLDVENDYSNETTTAYFNGAAPRNLRVSKAAYPDRITLSFRAVPHAEYYKVYRAEVPSTYVNNGNYDDSLFWVLLGYVPSDSTSNVLYSDYDDLASDADTAYLYTVQAGNDYAELYLGVVPEYSNVEKGWLLTPPVTVNADQGVAEKYIEITWSGVSNVKSFDIQRSTDKNEWTSIFPAGIPPVSSGENSFYYYPPQSDYGKQIYFRVISVQSSSESKPSSIRTGYTFVEGAPAAPTGVNVSKAEYGSKILVQWDKPSREDSVSENGGYTWEITRMAPGEDEIVVATFNSLDTNKFPDGVSLEDDVYTFEDTSGLSPNVVYEYTVKASCKVKIDGNDDVLTPGPSVREEGYLLSPPTSFETSIDYNARTMDITIQAPLGFDGTKKWQYTIEAQLNKGADDNPSGWKTIGTVDVRESVPLHYVFDDINANEFRFSVKNGSENSAVSAVVAPDEIKANDFTVAANTPLPNASLASADGLYPVAYTSTPERDGVTMIIEVDTNNDGEAEHTIEVNGSDIESSLNAISSEYSPAEQFVKYSYRAMKETPFGRKTGWTSWQEGWGALTGPAYIRMFEMWILKPFEHRSEFPADSGLAEKWDPSRNSLADKILNPSMDSQNSDSVASQFHGGRVDYSTANLVIGSITDLMNTSSVDVTFEYIDFGEREEVMANGSYTMYGAKNKGQGTGVSGEITVESDFYPAVVKFDALNTNNKQFTGNYKLNQAERGVEDVPVSSIY